MYSSGMWIGDIISDKSIEYNQNEVVLQLYADDVNYYTHTFKQPYPTYRGMDIDSIGWISN
jgi:hypothetical protein